MTSLPRDVLDKVLAVSTHFFTTSSGTVVVAVGAGATVETSIGAGATVVGGLLGKVADLLLHELRPSTKHTSTKRPSLEVRVVR